MTDLRKAAEMELEALEDIAEKTPTTHVRAGKAMIGDKEHVALWFDDSSDPIQQADYINQTKPEKMLAMIKALRQAPAQPEQETKREWVGLTDEDWNRNKHSYDFQKGVDWAEAILKEKNT